MKKLGFISLIALLVAIPLSAQLSSPAPQILIPAAGSVAGSNGTFFHTDLTLLNFRSQAQTLRVRWIPRQSNGFNETSTSMTLNALTGINQEDFVAQLGRTGLGALLISGVTS